jgi:probable FeS assembly SUF system protein SufT
LYRADNEPVNFTRDVDAVIVPAGVQVKLRQGQQGYITQALGGSFTVYVEGNLFRIAGKDADALGKEPGERPDLPPDASDDDVRQLAWQQMKGCYDPEIPINIVDLGLVYECEVIPEDDGRVLSIKMTLTAPGCGMGDVLVADVQDKVGVIPTVKRADVELVFDPPWDQPYLTAAGTCGHFQRPASSGHPAHNAARGTAVNPSLGAPARHPCLARPREPVLARMSADARHWTPRLALHPLFGTSAHD